MAVKSSSSIKRDWTHSWVKIRLRMDYNLFPVREHVKANAVSVVTGVLNETVRLARENVAPGRGPGPHPHKSPYSVDTGVLMEDIRIIKLPYWWRTRVFGQVGCTEQAYYGMFLEKGWTNPWTGNFWRYPWLTPAFALAKRTTSRWYMRKLNKGGSPKVIAHASE